MAKKIVKDSIYSMLSNYIGQISNIFRSFYSANILGPQLFGLWNIVQFYIGFGRYSSFGVGDYINRAIAYNEQAKDYTLSNYLIKIYFIYSVILSVFFFILGLIFLKIYYTKGTFYYYTTIFFQVTLIFQIWEKFVSSILQAKAKFKLLAYMRSILAISTLILVIYLIKEAKYYAMLISYSFGILISTTIGFVGLFYYLKIKDVIFSKNTSDNIYRFILISSLSLMLTLLLVQIIGFLDRFFVTAFYTDYENGIYLFASNIVNSFNLLMFSFTVVIYQKINELYGSSNNRSITYDFIKNYLCKLLKWFPLVLSISFFIVPIFIEAFFKKYTASIPIFKKLIFISYFYSLFVLFYYQLLSIKKQKMIFLIYTILLLIFSLMYFFVIKKTNISNIAYYNFIVQIVFLLINIILSTKLTNSGYSVFKMIKLVFFPIINMVIVSFSLDMYIILNNIYLDLIVKIFIVIIFNFGFFKFYIKNKLIKKWN